MWQYRAEKMSETDGKKLVASVTSLNRFVQHENKILQPMPILSLKYREQILDQGLNFKIFIASNCSDSSCTSNNCNF